jgi:hypothetical protein
MAGLVPAISIRISRAPVIEIAGHKGVTPVFDGLCPAMTLELFGN